jgi:putative flippase GtrA
VISLAASAGRHLACRRLPYIGPMRLVRNLPERWNKLVREALKFGIVGGANTVINYAVFNALVLTLWPNGQLKATVIATVVATITSYFMNRHWTYRDRPKSAMRRETALFVLFNTTGLVIELGVLAIAKYGLDIHHLLALNVFKTLGLAIATVFRFWSYRTFVFRPAPALATVSGPVGPATGGFDAEVLAAFDPVAELAEVVSEYETSRSAAGAAPPER